MNTPDIVVQRGHEFDFELLASLFAGNWNGLVATATALEQIEVYLRAAQRQMDRLDSAFSSLEDIDRAEEGMDPSDAKGYAIELVNVEAHFYFACWHRIERMMFLLAEVSGLNAATAVYKRYETELKRYARVRNDIQHIAERLPGRETNVSKKRANEINPMEGMWKFGSIAWFLRVYELGGITLDLNRAGLHRLEAIVRELDGDLRHEVRTRLGDKRETD